MDKKEYTTILASGSPRRREIMDRIGAKYYVLPSDKDEDMSGHDPVKMVKELSGMKARDAAEKILTGKADGTVPEAENYLVIGADTVVAYRSSILGKPATGEEAFKMIKSFSGDTHYVLTGITFILIEKGKIVKEIRYSVTTKVQVAQMSDEEIKAYVATGEPMDKAGAYAIQGRFAPYITGIEGDYYNIVGFPISSICHNLKELGISLI